MGKIRIVWGDETNSDRLVKGTVYRSAGRVGVRFQSFTVLGNTKMGEFNFISICARDFGSDVVRGHGVRHED
jgi:hypothetical protein